MLDKSYHPREQLQNEYVRMKSHGGVGRSIGGALALLIWDAVVYGSYVASVIVCPIWFVVSVVKSVSERPGWRLALLRIAIPAMTFGLVLANEAVQFGIAEANAARVVTACEEFHRANGRFPESLDELVPRYMPSVPRAKYCLAYGEFDYSVLSSSRSLYGAFFHRMTGESTTLRTGGGTTSTKDARTSVTNRNLWGPAVDQVLADEQVEPDGSSETLWPSTDHLNTVRDLATYNFGTSLTTIANHLIYDAFGRVTSQTDPTATTLFGFTARPFDPDTGLQNNLNRWYDAEVGRWLSEDPIGFAAGDANLYRYVGNGVTMFVDPTGLDWRNWWEETKGGGAGVLQGGLNIVNGVQDLTIGIPNLVPGAVNGIAYVEEKVGILNPDGRHRLRMPYIPSPDWSRGVVTHETYYEQSIAAWQNS